MNLLFARNLKLLILCTVFFLSDLCTWILYTTNTIVSTKIPTFVFFLFFRRLCRLSIQTIRFSWFVSYLSFTAIHFQDSGDRKKKGKSMAFSKESFNISQYKTGWFCGRKESSWENIVLNALYTLFIQIELMYEWWNYSKLLY